MAILDVQHIEKHFGDTSVLKDISFSLEEGQALSIIGSSGSGKTTLLRCLNFLETPDQGVISVRGKTLFDAADPATRREADIRKKRLHFGLVFQSFNLFPQYTALENVVLARKLMAKTEKTGESETAILAEGKALLEKMGLADRMENYPHQLSGGQQQRVAIARALASGARVILADEPTGNLDTANGDRVMEILQRLAHEEGYCVVVVTHDMSIAEAADQVLRMKDGVLAEQETA